MLFLSLIGAIWFAFVCPPKNFLYVKSQWYIFPPYKAIFYLPWHREFLFDAIRKHYKWKFNLEVTLVKFSSVTQSCPPFCDPMDCSMPGFPAHYQLLELTQTHVHWVSDASQPSHPLLSPLLLPSIFLSIRVYSDESVLYIRWPEYWNFSFSISPSNEYSGLISLGLTGLISLQSKGLSRVFSDTTVQKHQFFGTELSL